MPDSFTTGMTMFIILILLMVVFAALFLYSEYSTRQKNFIETGRAMSPGERRCYDFCSPDPHFYEYRSGCFCKNTMEEKK